MTTDTPTSTTTTPEPDTTPAPVELGPAHALLWRHPALALALIGFSDGSILQRQWYKSYHFPSLLQGYAQDGGIDLHPGPIPPVPTSEGEADPLERQTVTVQQTGDQVRVAFHRPTRRWYVAPVGELSRAHTQETGGTADGHGC